MDEGIFDFQFAAPHSLPPLQEAEGWGGDEFAIYGHPDSIAWFVL